MKEHKKPKGNHRFYKPLERPRRYPLELSQGSDSLHICLWSEDGKFKWTIAYWMEGGVDEGPDLHFVGDRPLDSRVNWRHFRELVVLGQFLVDEQFKGGDRDGETGRDST